MFAASESAELEEDDHVFDNGAQRTDKPGEIGEEVLPFEGVKENSRAICGISKQRQDKEQQRQTLARAFPLIFDDLRDAGSQVAYGRDVAQD